MPLRSVKLLPGVTTEVTPTQGMAQVVSTQLIRWRYAGEGIGVVPEKLGGWEKFYPISLGSPVRYLHAWEGINADRRLAVGCTESLNVIFNGSNSIITPFTLVTNPEVDFSTTASSNEVTIVDAGITTSIFDSIYLTTPVAVGGIVLYGTYQINTIASTTSYTILAAEPATSTVADGGAVPVFSTTASSSFVNVELANHGESVGDSFPISTSTTVGGITLFGNYLVYAVVDADNFTVVASNAATATATASMNGGDASITYYIGASPSQPAAGYGLGGYGDGGYGEGVAPTPTPGTPITTTNWSMDNWGEILLAAPAGGALYSWSQDSGFTDAVRVLNAPLINGGIFVAEPSQILVSWGSSFTPVLDPLQINWSSSGNFTNWTVSTTTQAGGFRIPTGSRIIGGLQGPQTGLIWTDLGLWAMDYIEPPLVFGFNSIANNCGLIARNAACVFNNNVAWMGFYNFFLLSGGTVSVIPCPVWDYVFQDLDTDNLDKITCAVNSDFGEIAWYFPSRSGGDGEVDKYVKVNYLNGFVWDFGILQRTAWIDQNVLGRPIGGDASGYVYQHETSPDADGQPMVTSLSTGYFEISDGEDLSFVDWVFPDFRYNYYPDTPAAVLSMQFGIADYPNDMPKNVGPYNITSSIPYINTRFRSRLASMTVGSSDLGTFWRLGALKIRTAPDGKR